MKKNDIIIKREHGFSLIEVLVSLVIIAIGLLGAMALQATSLREGQVSNYRNSATLIAQSVLEQIRADNIHAADFAITSAASATAATTDFKASATDLLPNGKGAIDVDTTTRRVTISLYWSEDRVAKGASEQEFTYVSGY